MKNPKTDPITPKKLCELGICISLSQGRRMVAILSEAKLERIIKEEAKKKIT